MGARKKELCDEVVRIDRLLNGNGEKGALEKVDDHETFIQQWTGAFKLLRWIFGTSVLGLILSIVGLVLRVL
jgi:hypothetical protein